MSRARVCQRPYSWRERGARFGRLRPGDYLFLYTDGVTEARGDGGEMFSDTGLEAALLDADRSSPEALVRGVVDDVRQFASQVPQSDDLTALAVRYDGWGCP